MEEVEIPSYFLCPISLQLMKDPVTLLTGITYDRESIERWLTVSGNHAATCPVTKQPLPASDLIPNHTLRCLIQAWCIANAANGVDRIPTPRPPVSATDISNLLDEARSSPDPLVCLRKLKEIVSGSEANRRCVEASGAVEFLAAVIETNSSEEFRQDGAEALSILSSLQISEMRLLVLIESSGGGNFIGSLIKTLQKSDCQSRTHVLFLLRQLVSLASPAKLANFSEENLHEVLNFLGDRPISSQDTIAALQVLLDLCPWGTNRVKAVKAGAVPILVDLLLEDGDKRVCELALAALEKLCSCAEGRAELVGHVAGVAVVSKMVLRVSPAASERAVRILQKLCRFSASPALLQEMLQVGAVSKLCLLLQVDCGVKEKERAREILRLHSRVWKNSPCLSPQFLMSYPAYIPLHERR